MMHKRWLYRTLIALLVTYPLAGTLSRLNQNHCGWVEDIRFPESDLIIKAKLDTGATTSSIYAVNTRLFKSGAKVGSL